ncbi:MAG TPA: hypothetical protein VJ672_00200 [Gemmatimonadaceae bacterium]|nr:hypothetical protein [Gemmatimonadaceae bacterium]
MKNSKWVHHPWVYGLALGTVLGTIILGVGGRLMMRVIALMEGTPVGWSVGGTGTVVFLGAVSGLAGGVVNTVLSHFLSRRDWLRTLIFFLFLVLITLRGLSPVRPLALALFMPLTLIFGVAFDLLWRQRAPRMRAHGGAVEASASGTQ